MTYRGNRLAAKLDKLAVNPAPLAHTPSFGRTVVLLGRSGAALLLVLILAATAAYVAGHPAGYPLLMMATPLSTAVTLTSPLRQASGKYRPDERERAMHLRAALWGSGGTLVLLLFTALALAWNSLAGGWLPATTQDFVAFLMLLVALPFAIAGLAAWLMTSAAGPELEFADEG